MQWQTSRFAIDLAQPRIMGIVNVTPDSFSDGGLHATAEDAMAHCEQLQDIMEGKPPRPPKENGPPANKPGGPAAPVSADGAPAAA